MSNVSGILAACAILCMSAPAMAVEFWKEGEPGYRQSIGEEGTQQTEQQTDFLRCSLRENLRSEFVEACAILKENERQHLECRYYPGTYENVPSAEITQQQRSVVDICSTEIFADKTSGGVFSRVWSALFGE